MLIATVVLHAVAYAAVILAGSPLVRWICTRLDLPKQRKEGLTGAGRFIGYFERFIILTLLLSDQYDAIAFIFAGKSIVRFSRREDVEYYLVGTLASMSWAILWGTALKLALAQLSW
jgi:hypothetical protein